MSATVDSITAQTASTTLNDTIPADKPAAENEAVIASAAEGRRLYIGNLAYATTEGELKDFFKDYLVESTSIPTNPRTNRPVGYAFVDLSTPTEAERAIAELNGKAILERKVSIQLARKPEAHTEGAEGTNGTGKPKKEFKKDKPRPNRRNPKTKKEGADAETAPTNVPGQVAPELTQTTKEALTAQDGAEGTTSVLPKTAKGPIQRKQRGPPEDGVPSKTKVMVANLPYDLTEEKLKEIFAEYEPSSAKIALRPIPRFMVKKLQARNEPRKGRGFGFVTLASEELQQKACNEMNGKEIEGREIAVKVAIDSPGKEDEDPNAPIEGSPVGEEGLPSTAEGSANAEAAVNA